MLFIKYKLQYLICFFNYYILYYFVLLYYFVFLYYPIAVFRRNP
jgi:hypothetical protein